MSVADLQASGMTLAPSTRGMGPNIYLSQRHFHAMLGVALVVHILLFTVYSLWPSKKVTDIPVRALSFKIGTQNRVAAFGQPIAQSAVPAPAPLVAAPRPVPVAKPVVRAEPPKPVPVRKRPVENGIISKPAPTPVPAPIIPPAPEKPAIAPQPQRYIREVGAPTMTTPQGVPTGSLGGAGTETTMTASAVEQIRARYEQQISAWIGQHQLYPAEAGGASGRVTMRIRVDRQGYVRYYAIERSSANAALDRAAIEMIRRANPVPAAPPDYPAENLIEFLIPIYFEAP